jgi:hypothetical protein
MDSGNDRLRPAANDADVHPHERTSLLSGSRNPRNTESYLGTPPSYQGWVSEDDTEVNEADLLLARAVSPAVVTGLAPETLVSSMFQDRQRRPSSKTSELCCDDVPVSTTDTYRDEGPNEEDLEAAPSSPNLKGRSAHYRHRRANEFLIDTNYGQFCTIFIVLMMTYFIACFDGTIMASSHPVITSYFHSSNSASWLSTAFLLTSTAFQPLVGRLSDSIGRKTPFLFTIIIFCAATAWCALANSMESFIAARAVCGLGAGGMMALTNIIIGDMVNIE